MSETKKGNITYVAKTGGIKLEGDDSYYNPVGKCKEFIKKEMEGSEVEITLLDNDDHKFAFIKTISSSVSSPTAHSTPATNPNSELTKMRSMCLSYAKDLVVADKVEIEKMIAAAQKMYEYVKEGYTGGA